MFRTIYQKTIKLASHRLASYWLAIIGFIESIFFPIPADILLLPLCLAKPKKAFFYAAILSIASVLGGAVGYLLGTFFTEVMQVFLTETLGKKHAYELISEWFARYGFLVIFASGFTPIPYKVFAIFAGIMNISFIVFFIASAMSRPLRFFLVAGIVYLGGDKLQDKINTYIEYLGWLCVVILVLIGLYLY